MIRASLRGRTAERSYDQNWAAQPLESDGSFRSVALGEVDAGSPRPTCVIGGENTGGDWKSCPCLVHPSTVVTPPEREPV